MDRPNSTLNQTVGRRIAATRRAAGLSQAELAARLHWPRDTLVHYEHGRRAIAVARLEQIAAALGIPPVILLMDNEALVSIFGQIANDPYLPKQVLFFLKTLAEEEAV